MLDWFPALTTTGALMFALWLCRNAIATRLTKSVQHEFDEKLENVRAELRKSEELFKAELHAKEREIDSLRSGALAGLVSRQAALDRRRLEAIDQLWASVASLGKGKMASAFMSSIKFEAALKETAKNTNAQKVFEAIAVHFKAEDLRIDDALKARPFVSPMAWALLTAYQAIISVAVTQLNMLRYGIDIPNVLDSESIKKLIKAALPQYAGIIDKFGSASFHPLIEELEAALLTELRTMMTGADVDRKGLEQAATIVKESQKIMQAVEQSASKQSGMGEGK